MQNSYLNENFATDIHSHETRNGIKMGEAERHGHEIREITAATIRTAVVPAAAKWTRWNLGREKSLHLKHNTEKQNKKQLNRSHHDQKGTLTWGNLTQGMPISEDFNFVA